MHAIDWILQNLNPREVPTVEMYYNSDSQSGYKLPMIYMPFDPNDPGHWADRGYALDFSTTVGDGRILDFGSGDGWPALIIAPFVKEIVGVEASRKRVEVCTENAARIGTANARFVYVEPGERLPFDDGYFDGIVAGSSIEETPDPRATLAELFRCLRSGGVLRFRHCAYVEHFGRPAQEIVGPRACGDRIRLDIWDRHLDDGWVRHIRLLLDESFAQNREEIASELWNEDILLELAVHTIDAVSCIRRRPSGPTLVRWLEEIGYTLVQSTYDGGWFARQMFHRLAPSDLPMDIGGIDSLLRPMVDVVVTMEKPVGMDGTITARK